MLMTCLTFALFFSTILTYIAKRGGISDAMSFVLFGPKEVRHNLQMIFITLPHLGYLMAVGRYSFPFFFLMTSLDACYFPAAEDMRRRWWVFAVLPVAGIVLYTPAIFSWIASSGAVLRVVVTASTAWVYAYLVLSAALLIWEFRSITSAFFRKRFVGKILLFFPIGLLFAIYAGQDPAQVYLFYKNDYMWMLGLKYLSPSFNPTSYAVLLALAAAATATGYVSTLRYVSVRFDERRQEVTLQRKSKGASAGISMFTHGTKNELLATRILLGKVVSRHPEDAEAARALRITSGLIERLNKLNHMGSAGKLSLVSCLADPICREAADRLLSRRPEAKVVIESGPGVHAVMADSDYLADALHNIIENAWEAQAGRAAEPVLVEIINERLWVSVAVSDRGPGVSKKDRKRIFEPFWSTKSSSTNWGMGMTFARSVVKAHMGNLRVEDREGGGARFVIDLPRVGAPRPREE